jgi:hypothetical protein
LLIPPHILCHCSFALRVEADLQKASVLICAVLDVPSIPRRPRKGIFVRQIPDGRDRSGHVPRGLQVRP